MTDEQTQDIEDQETQEERKDRVSEQFEKLTTSNKELKEQRDQEKADKEKAIAEAEAAKAEAEKYKKLYDAPTNQIPDATQFQNLNQKQITQTFQSMVDENGYLDGNKLMSTLQAMDARAQKAEQEARIAREKAAQIEKDTRDKQEKEAQKQVYDKYPQLNPENKEQFDPKMWKYVYNELAMKAKNGQMPTEQDYLEAADQVFKDFHKEDDMGKKDDQVKEEKIAQKQSANAIHPTSTLQAGFYSKAEESELVEHIRNGKRGAVAEMLHRRGQ